MPSIPVSTEAFEQLKKLKKINNLKWKPMFDNLAGNLMAVEPFFKSYDEGNLLNENTMFDFYDIWIHNYVLNMKHMRDSIQFLDQKFQEPALILGAGPSLDDKWDLIRQFKGKIFCPDRLVKQCLDENVKIDFITNVDSQDIIIDYLDGIHNEIKDIPAILLSVSDETYVTKFNKKIFIHPVIDDPARANPPSVTRLMLRLNEEIGKEIVAIPILGNVGLASWMYALTLGANPVVLLGVDMGYKIRKGVIDYSDSNTWNSLKEKIDDKILTFEDAISCFKEKRNPFGNWVWTDFIKTTYLNSFTQAMKDITDNRTIQCGEYSYLTDNVKCAYFADYIKYQDNISKLKYVEENNESIKK